VTHTVIATHFRKPVPRWADEGIAIMSESPEELQRIRRLALELLANDRTMKSGEFGNQALRGAGLELLANDRTMKLERLLPMKDYPNDVMAFFVQGYSLTEFLVKRKDRATLLAFVMDGMDGGWGNAAAKYYGFRDLDEMEGAWRKDLLQGACAKNDPVAEKTTELQGPPTMARAFLADGQIAVTWRESSVQPVTSYVQRTYVQGTSDSKTYYEPVTTYRPSTQKKASVHAPKEVKAFEFNGTPIEAAILLDRLKKETAVLLANEGKVDPFYLPVIKPGTMILVLPKGMTAPRSADAMPAAPRPVAPFPRE
jgi:hypothetical protein